MVNKSVRLLIAGLLMGLMGLASANHSNVIEIAECPCGGVQVTDSIA